MTQPIHILYVDDYPLDRELVRDALEREHGGFAVVEAKSRKEFEENLLSGGFDVVLSDFNILGFEGLQVLEEVKEKYPEIPVIIVTGTGSEEVAAEAIKRGAADYIIKTPKHIQRLPHIIHDALEKKQLEMKNQQMATAVTQTRELLTNLAQLVPGVIYQYRLYPDGHSAFPYSSPGMNRIYEYSPEEVREDASPVFGRLHPDDYEMVSNAIFDSARTLEEFYCEFRVVLPKQGLRWRWSQAHPERMPDGSTLWHGIISDITDRKIAESKLQESEEKFKYVFEYSPIGKSFTNFGGEIDVNQSFCEMLGYSKEELTNKNWREITHPDDVDLTQKEVDALQSGEKQTVRFTKRYLKKDGGIIWADVRSTIRRDPLGEPMYLVTAIIDITDRIIAEEALRISEKRFRTLFEHAPVGVALIETKTGRYLDINPKYCDFLGYSREEILQMSLRDVSHPAELQNNLDAIQSMLEGNIQEFSLEKRFICKDGSIKWGFLTTAPLWRKNDLPVQYTHIAVVQDITGRKESEILQRVIYEIASAADQAQNLNSLYSVIHASIQDVMPVENFYIALYDEKRDIVSFPYAAGVEATGEQPRKPEKGLTEYVLRTGKPALVDEVLEKELRKSGEVELVGLPSPIWLGVPLLVAGNTIGVMAVQDYKNPRAYGDREKKILEFVSKQVAIAIERKLAEEKLREREKELREMIDSTPFPVALVDNKDDKIFLWSRSALDLFGHTAPTAQEWYQIAYPDPHYRQNVINQWNPFLEIARKTGETVNTGSYEVTCKDGSVRVCELYARFIGRYLLVTFNDITERKQAEEVLRESEQRFHSLYDTMVEGVSLHELVYDDTGRAIDYRILDTNLAFEHITGIARDRAIGALASQLYGTGKPPYMEIYSRVAETLVPSQFESTFDPMQKTFQISVFAPTKGRFATVFQDITERKQAEEEIKQLNLTLEKRVEERTRELRETQDKLVRHEKLAVLGQLAGGIGHELRNPLGVINNAVYYLKMTQPDANEKVQSYLSIIENEVKNGEKIIHDLISFTRGVTTNKEVVSFPDLLKNVMRRLPVSQAVSYQMDLAENCSSVRVDPFHLEQVMYNLLLNAFHAITQDDSGLARKENKSGLVTIKTRKMKKVLEISVMDNGIGIPPENIQKIFEPLFTTKVKGMGLGLAISKKLIEANGGTIEVSSVINEGSTFTVHLPTNS